MKKLIHFLAPTLFILTILILITQRTQVKAQNLQWAKAVGGSGTDIGRSIAVDGSGNIYTTGHFEGTADFDPGVGTFNLTSAGFYDIFISKSDANGNFIWAKAIGGINYDMGYSNDLDASGNVYTTGVFQGTVDFDPGVGIFNLTSNGGDDDIFISKLDASGNFVWAKAIGGIGTDDGLSMDVDASGNVYTAGYFADTVDFDPGVSVFNLTSIGGSVFVSKLDNNGNFVWAKAMGDAGGMGFSVAVDASGNVYTTGSFQGTADFDPGAATFNLASSGGNNDVFVSKLDVNGNFVWAKAINSTGSDDRGNSIAIDASGNSYVTGYFQGIADFDPGVATFNLTSAGISDIFIFKMDVSGNLIWAKSIGGTNYDEGNSIVLDASGNLYSTGRFHGTLDFDPGAAILNLVSNGVDDIYISKLDAAGNFVWAKNMGGTNQDIGYSIALDASGNVYTTGNFDGPSDFDPGTGVFNLTTAGLLDIFICKLDQCNILVDAGIDQTICGNSSVTLNGTSSTGFCSWTSSGTGIFSPNNTILNPVYNPGAGDINAGIISLIISSSNNGSCNSMSDTLIIMITDTISISGTVNFLSNPVNGGTVTAYLINGSNAFLSVDTVAINGSGNYTFNSLTAGNYFIKAEIDTAIYNGAVPTYAASFFKWSDADTVFTVCGGSYTKNMDVIQTLQLTGTGTISGMVFGGNGPLKTWQQGDPIPGVDVSLEQHPGSVMLAQTSTDAAGAYTFSNVPIGNYSIYVDVPGLSMSATYDVNITADNKNFTDALFYVDSMGTIDTVRTIVLGMKPGSKLTNNISVYPNPYNTFTNISYELSERSNVSIEVYNVLGEKVTTLINATKEAGKYSEKFSAKNYNAGAGIYFVKITINRNLQTVRLVEIN